SSDMGVDSKATAHPMGVAPMLGSLAVKVHLRRLTRPQTLDKERDPCFNPSDRMIEAGWSKLNRFSSR
ncbi:hypothetical protein NW837_08345, partial [Synechococcus sp. R6-10]|uniref:hypothetical protein n=1 Tax=Synechococcus sp. R6-10 TaxID=2291956 RepID=UPI0039C17FD5